MMDGICELTARDDIDFMAEWLFAVWGSYNPGETLDTCRADLLAGLERNVGIPKTFVYRQGGALAGWASILAVDIFERPDLGPWLGNLIVLPEFRGRGIARKLIRHVMDYAQGVTDVLYLYTDNLQAVYEHMGWQAMEEIYIGDKPVMVMQWRTGR